MGTRELRSVFVIARHGKRTPCHPQMCFDIDFENSLVQHPACTFTPIRVIRENNDEKLKAVSTEKVYPAAFLKGGHCKPGQLAAQGAKEQYELGEKLRHRYVDEKQFLAHNEEEEILVYSSYIQRAIESARCILAGFLPRREESSNPLSIHVSPSHENMLLPTNPCLASIAALIRKDPRVISGLPEAIDKVKQDIKVDGLLDLSYLWDNLKTLKELELLPDISEKLWETISFWGSKWFATRSLGSEKHRFTALQMASGMLIDFLLHQIELLTNKKSIKKFHLFCGHDGTLWSLMHILQMPNAQEPPPTNSNLILEIYEEADKTWSIKVLFNDNEQSIGRSESLFCSVEHFITLTKKYRLTKPEHFKLCQDFKPVDAL